MRKKSILILAFLLLITTLIYKNLPFITQRVIDVSITIKSLFTEQKKELLDTIQTHFHQKEQIEMLKKKLKELEPQASLSIAFATRLNHLLKEVNLYEYHPKLHLVQSIGYETIQNRDRLWLDFPAFKKNTNYGLIFRGYTAGIIRTKNNKPLAILQEDKESLFSVFIGENHIQGIATGDGKNLQIQYIPNYENPHIGDEVITSGRDHIFYEGIKVGTIIKIEKKDMYKIATVKPYINTKEAHFFYAVEVE